jgi:hypothetical protein
MRKILIILFLLGFPSIVKSQTNFSNFQLKDGKIQFEKIYEIDGGTEQELNQRLESFLPTISGLKFDFNETGFTGKVQNVIIDYKKFGGKYMTTWIPLNYPLNGNISIQVKGNRYRLLLTNIETKENEFSEPILFDVYLTKNKGNEFTTNKTILNGLELLDKFLSEKFDILLSNGDKKGNEDDW